MFIPRNQLSVSFTVNPQLPSARSFPDWDASRLSECGTYLGSNDGIQNGGYNLSLIGGVNPFFGAPGAIGANQFLRLSNGHTLTPDKHGDFGLMAKWSPEWLDGTLGVYYRKTSDILPNLVLQPTAVGPAQLISGNIGSYSKFHLQFARHCWQSRRWHRTGRQRAIQLHRRTTHRFRRYSGPAQGSRHGDGHFQDNFLIRDCSRK